MAEVKIPEWLNEDFHIASIKNIENCPNKDIQIINVAVNYAVPWGVNFMSVIYNVHVKYTLYRDYDSIYERDYIVKAATQKKGFEEMAADGLMFDREIDMYEYILPELQKVLEKVGIKQRLGCRLFYTNSSPVPVIAMENLKLQGYVMGDKFHGLDFVHCKKTLEILAYLHGSSMYYFDEENVLPSKPFYYFPYLRDSENGRNTFNNLDDMKHILIAVLKTTSKFGNAIRNIENLGSDAYDVFQKTFSCVQGNPFNAQLHGDIWTSNIMFKYDIKGQLSDAMLVDYQISNYASIANDLHFFIFTSANDDVIENHFDALLEFYYEILAKSLTYFEYAREIPTLNQFKLEMKRTYRIALFVLMCMRSIMRYEANSESINNNENTISKNEYLELCKDAFKQPMFIKSIILGIATMDKQGYFE